MRDSVKQKVIQGEHVSWLLHHLHEYEACDEKGERIIEELGEAYNEQIEGYQDLKYNERIKMLYDEFVECFCNDPYDYQLDILENANYSIKTSFPENYLVSDSEVIGDLKLPIAFFYEQYSADKNGKDRIKDLAFDLFRTSRETCVKRYNDKCNEWKEKQSYTEELQQQLFGKSTDNSRVLSEYIREWLIDGCVCFIVCLVYLICLRESGVIYNIIPKGQVISQKGIEIGEFLKATVMIISGIMVIVYVRKLFWKTFVMLRLKQIDRHINRIREYEKRIGEINQDNSPLKLPLTDEFMKKAMKAVHYGDVIRDAMSLAEKQFSSQYLKEISTTKYVESYRDIRKQMCRGLIVMMGLCILVVIMFE